METKGRKHKANRVPHHNVFEYKEGNPCKARGSDDFIKLVIFMLYNCKITTLVV